MNMQALSTDQTLTIDDIRAAAARIKGAVINTAMDYSRTLSAITGADIWLKFENLQFTAAYKERGALNAMLLMDEDKAKRGVIVHRPAITRKACRTTASVWASPSRSSCRAPRRWSKCSKLRR